MMMSILLYLVTGFLLVVPTMAEITSNTTVATMLGMIPQCAMSCVMDDVFQEGGCPLTNAGELAACACTNGTIQSHLSACVQKSCEILDQIELTTFAASLCEGYPIESRTDELKNTAIVTIVLSVIFLVLRLYSRWLKTRRLWSDDAFAIIAAIFLIAVSIIILRMSLMGFGLHYWHVPPENGVALLKLFYVCQMLYILVQVFSKVAILVLFARLFSDFIRWFHWSVRGMIVFMFTHGTVFFLLVVFQCLPIKSIWNKTIDGKCIPITTAVGFTGAGLSIVEDFIILLLPIRGLWQLQLTTKKKVGVILLISVGSFASVTSIIRLKFVLKYANTYDSTWDNVDVIKWSLIEILSACICGNLLPIKPFVEKIVPGFRSVIKRYSGWSRKSSGKTSTGLANFSWFKQSSKSSEKPQLISTLNFTRMSLGPDRDWGNTRASDAVPPMPPSPVHFEKGFESHENYVEEGPAQSEIGRPIPMTPTKVFNTTQTSATDSDRPWSPEGSERNLVVPRWEREERFSGPWSRALTIFDRRKSQRTSGMS